MPKPKTPAEMNERLDKIDAYLGRIHAWEQIRKVRSCAIDVDTWQRDLDRLAEVRKEIELAEREKAAGYEKRLAYWRDQLRTQLEVVKLQEEICQSWLEEIEPFCRSNLLAVAGL